MEELRNSCVKSSNMSNCKYNIKPNTLQLCYPPTRIYLLQVLHSFLIQYYITFVSIRSDLRVFSLLPIFFISPIILKANNTPKTPKLYVEGENQLGLLLLHILGMNQGRARTLKSNHFFLYIKLSYCKSKK